MDRNTLANISLLAGTVALVSGLLVWMGYTTFLLGLGVGAINLRRGGDRRVWLGLGLSLLGLVLGLTGLFS